MELSIIADAQELNTFVSTAKHSTFLQSWEWGEFQKSLGRRIWRVGVKDNEKLLAVATIVEHQLPLGISYLYIPYGPLFHEHTSAKQQIDAIKVILTRLRAITTETKRQYEMFARIEPRMLWRDAGNALLNAGLKRAVAVQPQDTQVVDLDHDEEVILKRMHSKTRYNIRLAEKKGVTIREATSIEDIEIFWRLLQETTRRDNFRSHEKSYYTALFEKFGRTDIENQQSVTIKILFAEYEGKNIGAVMVGFFGTKALYLHGAFDHSYRKVMAPQLLQWRAMQLARKHGYTQYDFWGIKPVNRHIPNSAKEQAWEGITRFKKGFGGDEVNYVGAWEYVYDKKLYWLFRLIKRML
ncbi:MAG: lipid II:glycine glycyltransferase FemX [Patescibacteria group bacterium]